MLWTRNECVWGGGGEGGGGGGGSGLSVNKCERNSGAHTHRHMQTDEQSKQSCHSLVLWGFTSQIRHLDLSTAFVWGHVYNLLVKNRSQPSKQVGQGIMYLCKRFPLTKLTFQFLKPTCSTLFVTSEISDICVPLGSQARNDHRL